MDRATNRLRHNNNDTIIIISLIWWSSLKTASIGPYRRDVMSTEHEIEMNYN